MKFRGTSGRPVHPDEHDRTVWTHKTIIIIIKSAEVCISKNYLDPNKLTASHAKEGE